jgi:predicted nucleic acid-binding protein
MIVLDTSVLIDVLRGDPQAIAYVGSLEEVPFCSELTRVEVLQGIRPREHPAVEALFAHLRWVPVDEGIARRAGDLGREHLRSHANIGVVDLVIAATALELEVDVATLNIRHFPMFRGLLPPYGA